MKSVGITKANRVLIRQLITVLDCIGYSARDSLSDADEFNSFKLNSNVKTYYYYDRDVADLAYIDLKALPLFISLLSLGLTVEDAINQLGVNT
jgi:hypothetical protein